MDKDMQRRLGGKTRWETGRAQNGREGGRGGQRVDCEATEKALRAQGLASN